VHSPQVSSSASQSSVPFHNEATYGHSQSALPAFRVLERIGGELYEFFVIHSVMSPVPHLIEVKVKLSTVIELTSKGCNMSVLPHVSYKLGDLDSYSRSLSESYSQIERCTQNMKLW